MGTTDLVELLKETLDAMHQEVNESDGTRDPHGVEHCDRCDTMLRHIAHSLGCRIRTELKAHARPDGYLLRRDSDGKPWSGEGFSWDDDMAWHAELDHAAKEAVRVQKLTGFHLEVLEEKTGDTAFSTAPAALHYGSHPDE